MFPAYRLNMGRSSTFFGISCQICPRLCLTEKMNPCEKGADNASNSSSNGNSATLFHHLAESCSPSKNGSSHTERNEQGKYFASTEQLKSNESDHIIRKVHSSHYSTTSLSFKHGYLDKRRTRINLIADAKTQDVTSSQNEILPMKGATNDLHNLPAQFGKKRNLAHPKRSKSCESNFKSAKTEGLPKVTPFDLCFRRGRNYGVLESSLLEDEKIHNIVESKQQILRPGMVLLKQYLSNEQQVKVVNTCRKLGIGPGGFYRPGYKHGAKLNLQMMCLGMNWDPQTRKYEDRRAIDGCKPPGIPCKFISIVEKAMQDAHALIRTDIKVSNPEDILPAMSPNICIVNFYTSNGRLGLHQDRDESQESLGKGLPVVSFSVGDSAEFVYGEQRDVEKAEKVELESGDVLIFGGKSRHIYHGVTTIIPNSTPKSLLQESGIRPGRLNLTFRQF